MKSQTWEVEIDEHNFLVTGTYNPGEPRVTYGPADRWYPGSPECVEIEKVELVRGKMKRELNKAICPLPCGPGCPCNVWDALLEQLEEKILESMQGGDCGTDYDPQDAAERRAESMED